MKKNVSNHKGFTLVELLVVITVLGIIIAISIPTFFGYIQRQKEHAAMQECKQAVLACQQLFDNMMSKNEIVTSGLSEANRKKARRLAGIDGQITGVVYGSDTTLKIDSLSYTASDKISVVYDVTADPHYQIQDNSVYAPLEKFIKTANDLADTLKKQNTELGMHTLDRQDVIKAMEGSSTGLPDVSDDFLNKTENYKNAKLSWRPYYIETKSGEKLTFLYSTAKQDTAVGKNWSASIVYINGKIYESIKVHDYTGKPEGTTLADIGQNTHSFEEVENMLISKGFALRQ